MKWNEKVAIITGAGGVLLSAFSKKLASKGVKVMCLSKNFDHAKKTADSIISEGNIAKAYGCDVLDKNKLIEIEKEIYDDFGEYSILINGAGGNMPKANTTNEKFSFDDLDDPNVFSFFDLDLNEIKNVFSVNFLGTVLATQIFAKRMIKTDKSTIINFSSMAAFSPMTKVVGYSASKAAIDNFTKWLSVHFAEQNLRVNSIAPGFFLTNQNRTLLTNKDGSLTDRSKKILNNTPMKRFGVESDLFGALLFLCDDDASGFVTGSIIAVDGGFQAYSGV
jgi:NAD(P)-dependent dehydrogenase (short-subunit alcohol dehydrogenase family)